MKLTILTFFISLSMSGQSIEYEKIGKTDSLAKKEIFFNRLSSKLIELCGGQAKYDKNIIQSDKDMGVIKFKQELTYSKGMMASESGIITYNVNVYFKDGKFKIIFNDFFHTGKGMSFNAITRDEEYPYKETMWLNYRKKAWKEIKIYLNNEIPTRISIIEKIILTPSELEKEW